jgi:hypothetical protein
MNELKHCPFCGGEADISDEGTGTEPFRYWVYCLNNACFVEGTATYATEAQAIEAWNTRAEQTCTVTYDFNCSNCGKQIGVVRNCEMYETCDGQQAWKSLDHKVCDVPNYCPNCGAKVVSE